MLLCNGGSRHEHGSRYIYTGPWLIQLGVRMGVTNVGGTTSTGARQKRYMMQTNTPQLCAGSCISLLAGTPLLGHTTYCNVSTLQYPQTTSGHKTVHAGRPSACMSDELLSSNLSLTKDYKNCAPMHQALNCVTKQD